MVLDPATPVPPHATGTPQGIAVGPDGTLYYADLNLVGTFPNLSPGPNGKVWRIRFDGFGNPLAPEILRQNLAFPDGVAVHPGNLEPLTEWPTYAGSPARTFFNAGESIVTDANVHLLQPRWSFLSDAIITGSPAVGSIDLPNEGPTQAVYFLSWDRNVYALRLREGSELWRFTTEAQPGASFPHAASVTLGDVNGTRAVFIGSGEILYALDAATGAELWRFTAGTGCKDALGNPPGLCSHAGERNQIESSALFASGQVYFGMDVNDVGTGKGGFYGLDAATGALAWYFDLETGATCRPNPGDDIRKFDGYHSEAELGLPAGFLASRSGCNFARTITGCGNVWSTPAADLARGLLYFASSNCDTDNDPGTPEPPPPMPAYDEAIVALQFDGTPAWRWRPREVDNDDLAFGAAPNLFTITFGGAPREVLGIGNKDGSYYVLDRDGVNEVSGVAWNDANPAGLPYWTRNVVPGGDIGGIVATAAVDEPAGRIYFSTAPGDGAINGPPNDPQRPTMHALDIHTGGVVWNNAADTGSFASFGPTSAIPGVAFAGQVPAAILRAFGTASGALLGQTDLTNFALASAPAVVDGIVLVGQGIGTITASGNSISDITARADSELVALCVPGTPGCAVCGDAALDPGEECDDGNADDDDACWSDCEISDQLLLTGFAQGGSVRVIVDGVTLTVNTSAGASAASVNAQIAAAIQGNAALAARGVEFLAPANRLRTNGTLTGLLITDPGLVAGPPLPALPLLGAAAAAGALAALGAARSAKRRRPRKPRA
jgi:polyvinyl alcohol dehydrogenase (cytochrome)